ncbi:MAG: hydrolase [Tatlockia sp.]
MLLHKEHACLLLIDVQEKLTPHVMHKETLIANCGWLMRLASDLHIPQLISEQYPKGLGKTVAPLSEIAPKQEAIEKVQFSCWRAPLFKEQLKALNKHQLVLTGIEAHVCVLQTALDLKAAGFAVFVVADAVSSRAEIDYKYALKRMKQAGIELVTREMVFFEWIGQAGTAQFKALSKAYLQ